ncbi:MAG: hypothetical protein KDA17_04085 [Candidatus Saccharibacteria bacterium]|jgi:hypothetical protein|nr:hypothetical protein [Candidatus Saccharibacteria bacterium]
MQIFTPEMILEMLKQAKDTSSVLFESIITAAWSSVAEALATLLPAIHNHDWNGLMVGILMVVSGVMLLYRLIRNNLLTTLEFLINR